MKNKLSLNKLHKDGALSVFPKGKDSKLSLHEAKNNAEDKLRQTLAINGKYIVLHDASKFPDSGIIKITPANSANLLESFEVIFYAKKSGDHLIMLQRGYGDSSANTWPSGSKVSCPLMAEHHNALKDAIIQIQKKIGLEKNPSADSINGILNYLENKWLSPKPVFRAYPRMGASPLTITFHNFSTGYGGRYLWDFGDGTTSTEKNPIHTYQDEGKYAIRLTVISTNGSQGLTEKSDYIEVNNEQLPSFFYVTPLQGSTTTDFEFVDQSDGDIAERHWFFGDGTDATVSNPNIHTITHRYEQTGNYVPSLMIRLTNNKTRRVHLPEGIIVI
jgi:PKD repeat protein